MGRIRKEKQDEKEKQEKLEKVSQEKLAQSFKSFFKPKSGTGGQAGSQQSNVGQGDSSESGAEDGGKSSKEDTEAAAVIAGILNKFRVEKDMRLAPVSRRSDGLQGSERSALELSLGSTSEAVD